MLTERSELQQTPASADEERRLVARALAGVRVSVDACVREVHTIAEPLPTQTELRRIHAAVVARDPALPPGAFERFVLAQTFARSLDDLDRAPLADEVKRLWRGAAARCTDPRARLAAFEPRFISLCKMASLRRFPAGQLDWEPSGLPRSWLPRVRPVASLARLAFIVAARWRGFGPAYFIHTTATKPVPALLEREALRAYALMAASMERQPEIKGLLASSWLHSPDTFRVSPHLSWLNRVFADNGAIVATMGDADPECGVLHRSPERRHAYDEGRFRPTLGLIVWPRREMLAWAARHPELQA